MPRRSVSLLLVLLVAAVALAGACAVPIDVPGSRPSDVVRSGLERIFAGDIDGAAALVCDETEFDEWILPVFVSGIFAPTGSLATGTAAQTLALYEFDARGLQYTDEGGDPAVVAIRGVLLERLDPTEVEAAARAEAAVTGVPVEEALLEEALRAIAAGPYRLEVDEIVHVTRGGDGMKICGPHPSPGPTA